MVRVSPQSSPEELWAEVERLRHATAEERTRLAVAESQARKLEGENERLREKTRFVEELSQRVRAANEKLEILTSLTKELASFDLDGVLEVCVQRIPFLVGARCASVYLYDRAAELLTLKHHTHGREIDRTVQLTSGSLMAHALRTREVLCIDDLGRFRAAQAEQPFSRPYQSEYETSSCVVAPLVAAGEVEGILNLTDRFDQRPFDPEQHLGLIRQASELLAVSLRNARLFETVTRAARMCSLTAIRNRQAFFEDLAVEAKRARRYGHPLAVVAVDLSGLRLINANAGHQAGDRVLAEVAALLERNVRDVDLVGRTGGAEFGVLLPEQTTEGARVVAARLVRLFEARSQAADAEVQGWFGIAAQPGGAAEPDFDLFQKALDALSEARARGDKVGWGPEATPEED